MPKRPIGSITFFYFPSWANGVTLYSESGVGERVAQGLGVAAVRVVREAGLVRNLR